MKKSNAPNVSHRALAQKRLALIAAPPLLLLTTYLAYQAFVRLWGKKVGYLAGFLFYWLGWCLLFPLWLLKPAGVRRLFRNRRPQLGKPRWLGALFLLVPLVLGYGYAFPRARREASGPAVLASATIALINGALEELLWRGAYVALFPQRHFWNTIYPALGFAVWHFAPQSIYPNTAPGGNLSLVVAAGVLGLMWSWVARQSRSIRWTILSHVLFDFSGLGGRLYFR